MVREWLGNQAAGGYLTYDPKSARYATPACCPNGHPVADTNGHIRNDTRVVSRW
jgi:hypothetical protein